MHRAVNEKRKRKATRQHTEVTGEGVREWRTKHHHEESIKRPTSNRPELECALAWARTEDLIALSQRGWAEWESFGVAFLKGETR